VEFRVILIGLQKCKHWRKWVWSRRKIVCKGNPFPSHFRVFNAADLLDGMLALQCFFAGFEALGIMWH